MKNKKEQIIFDVIGIDTELSNDFKNLVVDKSELNTIMRLSYQCAVDDCLKYISSSQRMYDEIVKLKQSALDGQ